MGCGTGCSASRVHADIYFRVDIRPHVDIRTGVDSHPSASTGEYGSARSREACEQP